MCRMLTNSIHVIKCRVNDFILTHWYLPWRIEWYGLYRGSLHIFIYIITILVSFLYIILFYIIYIQVYTYIIYQIIKMLICHIIALLFMSIWMYIIYSIDICTYVYIEWAREMQWVQKCVYTVHSRMMMCWSESHFLLLKNQHYRDIIIIIMNIIIIAIT